MGLNVTQIEMTAYDQLPQKIRAVLQEADHLWSAAQVLNLWETNRNRVTLDHFVLWLKLQMGVPKRGS